MSGLFFRDYSLHFIGTKSDRSTVFDSICYNLGGVQRPECLMINNYKGIIDEMYQTALTDS